MVHFSSSIAVNSPAFDFHQRPELFSSKLREPGHSVVLFYRWSFTSTLRDCIAQKVNITLL